MGRTSFRLAEIIQLGGVSVYAYDHDNRWLPYEGSNISVEAIGYVGKIGHMAAVVKDFKETSDKKYEEKLEAVRKAREYYTFEGVIRQIDAFIQNIPDPRGDPTEAWQSGVYLRCQRVPDKDH